MVGLAQLLLKSNAASSLIEDYAACLELRSEESQIIENSSEDPGVLILQVTPVYTYIKLSSFTVFIFWWAVAERVLLYVCVAVE